MPALLVGFGPDVSNLDSSAWRTISGTTGLPPWLVRVEQQAGGMATSYYPSALGALLRLAANAKHARYDPKHLVDGFHCMAEDPQIAVLKREHPELWPLCATWGDAYSPVQLQHLRRATETYFRLPAPSLGHEAFVEYEPCDPLEYFEGWSVVEVADHVAVILGAQEQYGELWRDAGQFDRGLVGRLRTIGGAVLPGAPLRLFLLWENCD